ncbi:GFA family protein [Neptunicella sp. SCSIO 80796]|uniref:GFA family protein n=1 Tax=Neptunicella plasticusilytica TaxID=3117012 RepID=UPI003A4D8346
MTRTYSGSCHCQAVRFEVNLNLQAGTTRCNCSICTKARLWNAYVKATDLRIVAGQAVLSEYRFNRRSMQYYFCRICGVRLFAYINSDMLEDKFVSVQVNTLDDLEPQELLSAPIRYINGRQNKWWQQPQFTKHL